MKLQAKTMTIRICITIVMLNFLVGQAVAQYVVGQKFRVTNCMKYTTTKNRSGYYTMEAEVINVKPNNVYEVKIYPESDLQRPTIEGAQQMVKSLEIPQTVYYNEQAFTVTSVGRLRSGGEAYSPSNTVTLIKLPPTIVTIDEMAFQGYEALTQVTGAHSLRYIKDAAFAWCKKLESLPDASDLAFVEEIGMGAFYLTESFHTANLASIKRLGYKAFYVFSSTTTGLTSLVLGDQLADSIPQYCFYNNRNLTSVEIPAGVNRIGKSAFGGCNIDTLIVHATTPPTLDGEARPPVTNKSSSIIYVPYGCKDIYESTYGWNKCNIEEFGKVDATGISLNRETINFTAVGQTATLTATVLPNNATDKTVTWISNNTSVATVDANGKVTAVANGTATITARTNDGSNLSASCSITVNIPILATGISLNNTSLTFTAISQTATLTATVLPNNATNKNVTWSSSNIDAVTVNGNGVVTAVAYGTATITAKTTDGTNLSVACEVTVDIPIPVITTDISQLDNVIYIVPFTARVGDKAQMDICLKNANAATAYVFDLVLPEGITVAKNDNGKYIDELSNRHEDHTRTLNYKGENVYSLSTLSGNSEELTGNDGAIRLVTIEVPENMAEGDYAIEIKNASYSKPDGTLVTLPDTRSAVTVEDYIMGDVNGNGGVDIGDAVSIVNYLVGKSSTNFVDKAADTNKNGQIDIGDAVTVVNLLVGKIAGFTREYHLIWDDKEPE